VTKTILVVDDEPSQRLLYRDILEQEGYAVMEAEGAETALKVLGSQAIDLAILDIRMQGTHGLDLLARLHDDWPHVPVILCSGVSSLFGDYAVWDAGDQVVGLFAKPVNVCDLTACVGRVLGAPSAATP
jgi:DNA-binding NtrC family response regulator